MKEAQLVEYRRMTWMLFEIANTGDQSRLIEFQQEIESFVNQCIDAAVMSAVAPFLKLKVK